MREGGLALTQLATHSAKLSIKAVVKVRGGGRRRRKKKTRSPSADALWAAYSGISQKLKASNEDSATPPRLAQRDRQATWSLYIEA